VKEDLRGIPVVRSVGNDFEVGEERFPLSSVQHWTWCDWTSTS
jgi:hypothetical protein